MFGGQTCTQGKALKHITILRKHDLNLEFKARRPPIPIDTSNKQKKHYIYNISHKKYKQFNSNGT
ncbi:MAG: hypothetical protein DHS20C18_33730 [Saprospiraceae bacterium]|nr:MAG: hypothetical protein DHS20C18_33730 [Saprospiraceae bacterium]